MLTVIVGAGLFAALFLYSTTRREVQIAQHMIDDASRLQVGKSSLIDVLAFARRYNGEVGGTTHGKPCLESDCLVTVAPNTNDFWERHPKLGYVADRISRRGWHFKPLDVDQGRKANGDRAVVWLFDPADQPFHYHHPQPTWPGPVPKPVFSTASHVCRVSRRQTLRSVG